MAYTDEYLIQLVKEKEKELGRKPNCKEITEINSATYRRRFGSWNNVLRMADISSEKYSKEKLLQFLVNIKNTTGKCPTHKDCKKYSYYLKRSFGSFKNALSQAGLQKDKQYNKEELIILIQNKAREIGRTPNLEDIKPLNSYIFIKHFGGWRKALKEAGLISGDIESFSKPKPSYTRDKLISILQDKYKELNKIPITHNMKHPSHHTFAKHFGSWKNALLAAGIKRVKKEPKPTKLKINLCFVCNQKADGMIKKNDKKICYCCSRCYKMNFIQVDGGIFEELPKEVK